jgi:hypothetical protein
MIGGPDVRIGVGHFFTLNAGRLIPLRKGFRLSDVAWFQRIISGKRFDPGLNWRARKVGKTWPLSVESFTGLSASSLFWSMDDLLLQRDARRNGNDRSFDFRWQQGKPANHPIRIAATSTGAAEIKLGYVGSNAMHVSADESYLWITLPSQVFPKGNRWPSSNHAVRPTAP